MAPVTFAPAGAMPLSTEFWFYVLYRLRVHNYGALVQVILTSALCVCMKCACGRAGWGRGGEVMGEKHPGSQNGEAHSI